MAYRPRSKTAILEAPFLPLPKPNSTSLRRSSIGFAVRSDVPLPAVGSSIVFVVNGREDTGNVAFAGGTRFADGDWVGVVLATPTGKNCGTVQGVEYFTCKPDHGLFIRPNNILKVEESPSDAVEVSQDSRRRDSAGARPFTQMRRKSAKGKVSVAEGPGAPSVAPVDDRPAAEESRAALTIQAAFRGSLARKDQPEALKAALDRGRKGMQQEDQQNAGDLSIVCSSSCSTEATASAEAQEFCASTSEEVSETDFLRARLAQAEAQIQDLQAELWRIQHREFNVLRSHGTSEAAVQTELDSAAEAQDGKAQRSTSPEVEPSLRQQRQERAWEAGVTRPAAPSLARLPAWPIFERSAADLRGLLENPPSLEEVRDSCSTRLADIRGLLEKPPSLEEVRDMVCCSGSRGSGADALPVTEPSAPTLGELSLGRMLNSISDQVRAFPAQATPGPSFPGPPAEAPSDGLAPLPEVNEESLGRDHD